MRSNDGRGDERSTGMCGQRPGGQIQVALEDRCPLLGVDFHEAHRLPPAVAQHGLTVCRLHVAHPVGLAAQHGDEIALALDVGDHHGERNHQPASTATDGERSGPVWKESSREGQARDPVLHRAHAFGRPLRYNQRR